MNIFLENEIESRINSHHIILSNLLCPYLNPLTKSTFFSPQNSYISTKSTFASLTIIVTNFVHARLQKDRVIQHEGLVLLIENSMAGGNGGEEGPFNAVSSSRSGAGSV